MARGISAFTGYHVKRGGGMTFYCCPLCSFNVRRTGNALGGASVCKAAIRKHRNEKHPEPAETTP